MVFPRNSLSAFLSHSRRKLADCVNGEKITIVTGNQSADLDSFSCSLLYAYIKSCCPPKAAFSPFYIPVLSLENSQIRTHPELEAVCRHVSVKTDDLITVDKLGRPNYLTQEDNVRWVLVDHNKPTSHFEQLPSSSVLGVLDHHEEEHFVSANADAEPRIIEKVGSCTSLVLRYCRPAWDAISSSSLSIGAAHGQGESAINDNAFAQGWDASIAKMALASILIDTANLTNSDKVTPVDNEAVEYLEAKIMMVPQVAKTWNRDKFYEEINEAKMAIDHLSLDEILRKDYKAWTENGMKLGMSSVVRDLEFLVSKAQESGRSDAAFNVGLQATQDQLDLDVYAIMTTSKSVEGSFQRQLLLQVRPGGHAVAKSFLNVAQGELKLEDLFLDGMEMQAEFADGKMWRKAWWQRDLSKSRKQVGPMLRQAMQKHH